MFHSWIWAVRVILAEGIYWAAAIVVSIVLGIMREGEIAEGIAFGVGIGFLILLFTAIFVIFSSPLL
jgi:uncharacterized phage infection (PIP) family protein YhgE